MLSWWMLLAFPNLGGTLANAKDGLARKQLEIQFRDQCVARADALNAKKAEVGAIAEGNVQDYAYANLIIDPTSSLIEDCAGMDLGEDTQLIAQQQQVVMALYETFVAQRIVVDAFGDGTFIVKKSHYFSETPLASLYEHELCDVKSSISPQSVMAENVLLQKLQVLQNSVVGTSVTGLSEKIAADYMRLSTLAMQKSEACMSTKLDTARVYQDGGTQALHSKWDAGVRSTFAKHSNAKIEKIIFVDSDPRDVREERRTLQSDGTVKVTKVSFDAWEGLVYVFNGEYVDGYRFEVVTDYIEKRDTIAFYDQATKASHRVLKKNY